MSEGHHPAPSTLAGLDLFAGCDAHERERAANLLWVRRYAIGDVVLEAGEADRRFLIVTSGSVTVTTKEGVEGRLGPGDILGEMSLLAGAVRNATVVAARTTEVLVADEDAFGRLRQIADVGRRIRAVNDARDEVAGASIVEAATVAVFVRRARVTGRGAGLHARAERRGPVRLVVAGLAALVAVGVGAFLVVGNASTPVAFADVAARFDAATVVDVGEPAGALGDDAGDATMVDAEVALTAPLAVTAVPASRGTVGGEPSAPPTDPGASQAPPTSGAAPEPVTAEPPAGDASPAKQPSAEPRPFLLPEPGIYTYATTGGERISVPNGEHRYPEETFGMVRHGTGCGWSMERLILEEHTEIADRCNRPGTVHALRDARTVSFFGQGETTEYRCDPPALLLRDDAPPGERGEATCRSDQGDSATYRGSFLGDEVRTIGGVAVRTSRIHLEAELTGSVRGTSTVEFWFDAVTGLLVREERSTRADVDSDIGHVRYEEDATFELVSMTPRR